MRDDPIVAEVRSARERLAAQFDFDVHAIFRELRSNQTRLGTRLVRRERQSTAESAAASRQVSAGLHPGR